MQMEKKHETPSKIQGSLSKGTFYSLCGSHTYRTGLSVIQANRFCIKPPAEGV